MNAPTDDTLHLLQKAWINAEKLSGACWEGISLVMTATRQTVFVRNVTEIAYVKSSVRSWMLRPF